MAAHPIRVEYNQDLKALEELLSGVARAGDFFTSGAAEIPMPKLEVEGVGVLSFPVPPGQAAALVRQATRAPYGRGESTILDESVRKVWQLPPDKVRLSGKSWPASLNGILKRVTTGLGCEGLTVSAELYKLLVYDEGGFFLAHRDTEKAGGMFGTLVVALPSAHRGGDLVIRHAGRSVTVDLGGDELSEVKFAAFHADCEHEMRPITEGNRVCLVYNLIKDRAAKDQSQSLHAPDYEGQTAGAATLLERNLSRSEAPVKIAWLLEHQYSPGGLAFAALKSADAARVKALTKAAERAGCAAHLGIVHIEESGAAEPSYGNYRPRGWGRYRDSDRENTGDSGGSFEVIEVFESRRYVDQWRDPGDRSVEFGEIPLGADELPPAGALDKEKPDEQRLMEASGNEGASFDRSYHRAALVIWRRERYAEVLLQAGVPAVLPYLQELIAAAAAKNASPAARSEAVTLARRLIVAWEPSLPRSGVWRPPQPGRRDAMLSLLHRLGEVSLLREFIEKVVTPDYDGGENAELAACAWSLGAKEAGRLFSGLVGGRAPLLPGPCVDLMKALASGGKAAAKPERLDALRQIAGAFVSQLDEIARVQTEKERARWASDTTPRAMNAALVAKLFDVLGGLDEPALGSVAAEKVAAHPALFDPAAILAPALALMRDRNGAAAALLWERAAEFLLARSGDPPAAPRDWCQEAKLSCKCADCRELQAFALDPAKQIHRFKVAKELRQHLHNQIDSHGLDITHVTERVGSPLTLVCTKDRRSYQRGCGQYRRDIAALETLADHARKTSIAKAGALKRVEAACARAAKWSPG